MINRIRPKQLSGLFALDLVCVPVIKSCMDDENDPHAAALRVTPDITAAQGVRRQIAG